MVKEAPRQYLRGFTSPADTKLKPQLVMVEPYQRGKIPVIMIHGLYSDPITWVDTANELRQQYDIYQEYQFWVYRYPTGGELLDSAAELRAKLRLVRATYAPAGDDPALDAMVLIGHSLGGIVSKMQVVTSYDLLWRRVAVQPFGAVAAEPQLQLRLSRDFFFEPVPGVNRVIFVGTPFHGSELTRRLVGRLGDELVAFGTEEDLQYDRLMEDNPEVFRPEVTRRRPTTVDLLEPDSPLLVALAEMPVAPCVRLHTIIGTGGTKPLHQPSDGVVSVASARHPGVESELWVPAKHEKLHRHPDSIAEMARILREHARLRSQATARRPKR